MRPIYLDCHATTPMDKRVLEAMMPFFLRIILAMPLVLPMFMVGKQKQE